MTVRTVRPAAWPTAASFLLGLLLGTALVAPVIPSVLAALPPPTSFGLVGTALIVSVLSLVAFVTGLVAIYVGLHLVEEP